MGQVDLAIGIGLKVGEVRGRALLVRNKEIKDPESGNLVRAQ